MIFTKIILAIDGSNSNHSIVDRALEIAKIHQAELMLFRSIPNHELEAIASKPLDMGLAIDNLDYNYQEQQQQLGNLAKQELEQLKIECETATNLQISIDYQYRIGDPGSCICEIAQEWDASLIIVGRRGYTGLVEAFLGSVSNYVVHYAPCPVLVIQTKKK